MNAFQEQFQKVGALWGQDIRTAAMQEFERAGLPTRDQERWRYTDMSELAKIPFELASQLDVDWGRPELALFKPRQGLIFVNGKLVSSQGVKVRPLSEAVLGQSVPQNAFVLLNTAMQDGVWLDLSGAENNIEIVFVSTQEAAMQHPRLLITLQKDSKAQIFETYCATAQQDFTNAVVEIVLEDGTVFEHIRLLSEASLHVSNVGVVQKANSQYSGYSMTVGGKLSRTDWTVALQGSEARCDLFGLYLASSQEHVDYHTVIDHQVPNTTSREQFKGIVGGNGTAVFNGQILVQKDAQKSDAALSNKNILLSKQATVNTKPELEIYANDVKCAHGATVGQLDPQALFYLRSRGISLEDARKKLIEAFASDMLTVVPNQEHREVIKTMVEKWLAQASMG
jgi:Fe-S cluster assembly protein SufD